MATSKSLKTAVKKEVKEAAREASTGNEVTAKQGPNTLKDQQAPVDLPTNARSHPPE